jgi:hypothetical protein
VRIADGLKTKDVTIVMESTDPGNVDFGVYFDQHSLRNSSSQSTTLTIKLMDTGAAGNAATAATPLLNNPYDLFKLGINGVLTDHPAGQNRRCCCGYLPRTVGCVPGCAGWHCRRDCSAG